MNPSTGCIDSDDQGDGPLDREAGFTALRHILGGLARRRPLVLWIDDLQWSDPEGSARIADLLAQTSADTAAAVYQQAIAFYQQAEDPAGEAQTWFDLGASLHAQAAYSDAISAYRSAAGLWEGAEDAPDRIAQVEDAIRTVYADWASTGSPGE